MRRALTTFCLLLTAGAWAQDGGTPEAPPAAVPSAAPTPPPAANEVVVEMSDLQSDKGKVRVVLYTNPDDFPTAESKGTMLQVPVSGKKATAVFTDVKPGTYAVGTCHDENANGKCDTNFLGIPKEGVACSHNAHTKTMFIPKWKDAQFVYKGGRFTAPISKYKY